MGEIDAPILLFGMPRSGTTWIGKIFDSSPHTLYRHEPDSWGTLNTIPLMPAVVEAESYSEVIKAFLERLPLARKTKVAASLPIFPKSGESAFAWRTRSSALMAVKALSKYIGEMSVPAWLELRAGRLRPVWKSIESTGRLGVILRTAPECKAIHILRHPCGYVASVLRGEEKNKFECGRDSEDFGLFEMLCQLEQAKRRSLSLSDFRDMRPAVRLAWRWLLMNEKARDDCQGLGNYRTISYDRVCAEPLEQSRAMFDFVGLAWAQQTENFLSASTGRENDAYYSVFKDPLRSANKWRTELSSEDVAQIMGVVDGTWAAELFA